MKRITLKNDWESLTYYVGKEKLDPNNTPPRIRVRFPDKTERRELQSGQSAGKRYEKSR